MSKNEPEERQSHDKFDQLEGKSSSTLLAPGGILVPCRMSSRLVECVMAWSDSKPSSVTEKRCHSPHHIECIDLFRRPVTRVTL